MTKKKVPEWTDKQWRIISVICALAFLFLIIVAFKMMKIQRESDDYVDCGILANSCPEGFNKQLIGGQCIRCYKALAQENLSFDWERICEEKGFVKKKENNSFYFISNADYLASLNGSCRQAGDCFTNGSLKGCSPSGDGCNWCCKPNHPGTLGGCSLLMCLSSEEYNYLINRTK